MKDFVYPSISNSPDHDLFLRLLDGHAGPDLMAALCGSGSPEEVVAAALRLGEHLSVALGASRIVNNSLTDWNLLSRADRLDLLEYIFCNVLPAGNEEDLADSWTIADLYERIGGKCFNGAQVVAALLLNGYLPWYCEDGVPVYAVRLEELPPLPTARFQDPRMYRLSDAFRSSEEGQQLLARWDILACFNFPEQESHSI